MTTFLTILRKFSITFRWFPKICQNCSEGQTNVFEHFQTFPNIFRRLPKTTKEDMKMFRSCTSQGAHNLAELPVYLSSSCHVAHKAPAKRSQHANATYRNTVGRNMWRAFGHRVATCWVLLAQFWPFSNLSQQHPTCCDTLQHGTISCVGMLRSFGRGPPTIFVSRYHLYLAPVFPSHFLPFSLRRPSPCCPWSSRFSPPLWGPELQSFCSSFLMMWPMNFHLLLRTSSPTFSISAIFRTSLNSFLPAYFKYPSKASALEDIDFVFIIFIHLPRLAAIHHIKTGFIYVLYSLTLVRRLMLWLLQIFLNLKNTPLALWMSSVPPPSLETVAPKYPQIYQHPLFLAHQFTSTVSLFHEFIRSRLHLSLLIFSPTLPASWASLSVLVWMCCPIDDKRALSTRQSCKSVL